MRKIVVYILKIAEKVIQVFETFLEHFSVQGLQTIECLIPISEP